jgi:HD superfamily phosphodiesterase
MKSFVVEDKMNTQTGKQIALERHRFMDFITVLCGMGWGESRAVVLMQHVF